jgi:glyoxalase family protein
MLSQGCRSAYNLPMAPKLLGLHHVTATVDDAQADLDFCIELLGMRLVKKTVNFDNHNVYHFYYGDEAGHPGTIWTTFPYKGYGVRVGSKGSGQVVATSFSVPAFSMAFWRDRLKTAKVDIVELDPRFDEEVIRFDDPSGLIFELIGTKRDERQPWTGSGVGAGEAIRGIHSVSMVVKSAGATVAFMTNTLGYRVVSKAGKRTRLAAGIDAPGHYIDVVDDFSAQPGINGVGTVHHVAMAIETAEEQTALQAELLAAGVGVTDIRDRTYFTSIYFREPGGVLFEVATMKPGFTFDEELSSLGRALRLPPWEEPHRPAIEANLAKVTYRS